MEACFHHWIKMKKVIATFQPKILTFFSCNCKFYIYCSSSINVQLQVIKSEFAAVSFHLPILKKIWITRFKLALVRKYQNCDFFSEWDFISHNCKFIPHNYDFMTRNCTFISHFSYNCDYFSECMFISCNYSFITCNSEKKSELQDVCLQLWGKKSQNCEIKSHNYILYFFLFRDE